jgi:hypothetical protein
MKMYLNLFPARKIGVYNFKREDEKTRRQTDKNHTGPNSQHNNLTGGES